MMMMIIIMLVTIILIVIIVATYGIFLGNRIYISKCVGFVLSKPYFMYIIVP